MPALQEFRSIDLPSTVTAPALARRLVRDTLAAVDADADIIAVAALLVSELATNAVLHGGPPVTLLISRSTETAVIVGVEDTAAHQLPELEGDPMERAGGWGLRILDALATRWWIETDDRAKRVWFRLDLVGR